MTRPRQRLWWALASALFASCFGIGPIDCGLRAPAGGQCNPFANAQTQQCVSGTFCARTETCTKACTSTSECRTPCTIGDAGVATGCAFLERCVGGFCESPSVSCVDGFCQGSCPAVLSDGTCDYDLYGPSTFAGQQR